MKERPILFSAPMILAILEGKKTQTRRVIKPQPVGDEFNGFNTFGEAIFYPRDDNSDDAGLRRCPFGQPGGKLWVRENYRLLNNYGKPEWDTFMWPHYEADGVKGHVVSIMREFCKPGKHPSIHMPRWASRITLEITAVRVERLNCITEEDVLSEGATYCNHGVEHDGMHYRCGFRALWDSLNSKSGHGWDVNDWVWVIEFRRFP